MRARDLRIISGGQTGADLAGLWVAKLFEIPTGGMAPLGWRTQLGPRPELRDLFGLSESQSGYHGRTLENCESSDLTLIFASNIKSPGTKLTLHHCVQNGIRYQVFPFSPSDVDDSVNASVDRVVTSIRNHVALAGSAVTTLNIAGNSTSTSSLTFSFTFHTLCAALTILLGRCPPALGSGSHRLELLLRDSYAAHSFP